MLANWPWKIKQFWPKHEPKYTRASQKLAKTCVLYLSDQAINLWVRKPKHVGHLRNLHYMPPLNWPRKVKHFWSEYPSKYSHETPPQTNKIVCNISDHQLTVEYESPKQELWRSSAKPHYSANERHCLSITSKQRLRKSRYNHLNHRTHVRITNNWINLCDPKKFVTKYR